MLFIRSSRGCTSSLFRFKSISPLIRTSNVFYLPRSSNSVNYNQFAKPSTQNLSAELFTSEEFYRETRKELREATTLSPEAFTSREFLEVEKRNVFENAWVCVGLISQIPNHGDTLVMDVGTQPIIITRTKNGDIKTFKNVCRHRGHLICLKSGRYPTLMCPYHKWSYSLDGKLLATPQFFEGDSQSLKDAFSTDHLKGFDKNNYSLFPVRTAVLYNMIYVNLSDEAPSFTEYIGDLHGDIIEHGPALANLDETVSYKTKQYDCKANWKLLVENFAEYLHLPTIHPTLVTVSEMDNHVRLQGKGCYIGLSTDPLTSSGTSADPEALPHFSGITKINERRAVFHLVFPNVFYFLFPHSMYTIISSPDPNDPGRTIEFADLTVRKTALETEEGRKTVEDLWNFLDGVNIEDLVACERVQLGLRTSEYRGGRYSFKFEETLHRLHNMVADYMTGNPTIPEGDKVMPPGSARPFRP